MIKATGGRSIRSRVIAALAALALTMLCLTSLSVSSAAVGEIAGWMEGFAYKQYTDYGGTPATLNGLQFDGGKMPLGMFGQNFFLGYDENGNFAVERSTDIGAGSSYGAFDVTSRVKAYADGFSTTFSFQPTSDRGDPEPGGTFAIGLGDGSENPFAFMYIVFRYNGSDLDMYLIFYSMAHGYNVADGVHSCYNKGSLVELSTLATRDFEKPKLNEKITLQLKKITKEEADVYNADPRTKTPVTMDGLDKLGNEAPSTGKSCWRWIVNGVVLETPAFSEAQEKGPMFDAYSLPKDENGEYYGYLWADCNFRSGIPEGMLSSSNVDTTATGHHIQANLSGRLTFYDIVTDGSAGGAPIESDTAGLPGTQPGAASGLYSYASPTAGPYRGKPTVSSTGQFSFQYTDPAKLNAMELKLGLKKIDYPNGGSFRILFKKTEAPGSWDDGAYRNDDPYFGVVLKKTAWNGMAVSLVINGEEYPTDYTGQSPYQYDFKNSGEILLQLFSSGNNAYLFLNGRDLGCSSEIASVLSSFARDESGNPEGYLYLQNDSGSARVTIVDKVVDGSAIQKTLVTSIIAPADVTVAYGGEYSLPERVKVYFDDRSSAEWAVTWSEEPDTLSSQVYEITGRFTDQETLEQEYLIPSDIVSGMTFLVTVDLDPAFLRSENLGTGYNKTTNQATIGPEGYRWYSVYSVQIPYLYKQDEGYVESVVDGKYEHLMTDPSLTNRQFHTSDLVRKDVNGYELEFSIKNHSPAVDPDIYILLTASPGHPEQIGQGNVGLHFVPSAGQTKMYANLVTWMNGAVGGLPEGASIDAVAYFQRGNEAPVREIDFDFTGATKYKLRWSLSGDAGSRQVNMTLETPDGVYAVVDEQGNHIAKADYQFNENHVPTTLEPNGQFVNEKGYLFIWVERGYNEIIFRQHYKEYIASYDVPSEREVPNNTPLSGLGLPDTIDMTTNKNVVLKGSVSYSGYDPAALGTQEVTGTVIPPQDCELDDHVSETFTVRVTVKGMIASVLEPQQNLSLVIGERLNLPTSFKVLLNGEIEQEISFVWVGDWDALTPGEYVLTATPLGYYEYADGVNPMRVTVTVTEPEPSEQGGCKSSAAGCLLVTFLAAAVCAVKRKFI